MQPGPTLVFLDANVLFSRTLRDWFCLIDQESGPEGISLKWSEDVLVEFLYHMRKKNPLLSDHQVGGWRQRLINTCPTAMVTGYKIRPELLESIPDQFDAHVMAAAEHGLIDYLVTNDSKDFRCLEDKVEFEIYEADDMLCLIDDRRPDVVGKVLRMQLAYWNKNPNSKSLDKSLNDARAPKFAAKVKSRLGRLAMTGRY